MFSPPSVVDTIGAGDTFIASFIFQIHKLLNTQYEQDASIEDKKSTFVALNFATKVAGVKCGQLGFENLIPALQEVHHHHHNQVEKQSQHVSAIKPPDSP